MGYGPGEVRDNGGPEKSSDFLGRGGAAKRTSSRIYAGASDTELATTKRTNGPLRCGETPGQERDRERRHMIAITKETVL